jgi:hypothetical protein
MTFNFLCSYGCFDIDISFYFSGKLALDLEPWMVGRYTNGSRPMEVTGLLKAATSRVLGQMEVEIKEGYGELMVSVQC